MISAYIYRQIDRLPFTLLCAKWELWLDSSRPLAPCTESLLLSLTLGNEANPPRAIPLGVNPWLSCAGLADGGPAKYLSLTGGMLFSWTRTQGQKDRISGEFFVLLRWGWRLLGLLWVCLGVLVGSLGFTQLCLDVLLSVHGFCVWGFGLVWVWHGFLPLGFAWVLGLEERDGKNGKKTDQGVLPLYKPPFLS